MKIQADIPEEINKELKIVKIKEGHKDIKESLVFALREYFKKNGVLDGKK